MDSQTRKEAYLKKAAEAEERVKTLESDLIARQRWLLIAENYRRLAKTT